MQYQIATYSGVETVYCNADDDTDYIIAKAKRALRRAAGGSLPFGYQSFKIIEREDYYGE